MVRGGTYALWLLRMRYVLALRHQTWLTLHTVAYASDLRSFVGAMIA